MGGALQVSLKQWLEKDTLNHKKCIYKGTERLGWQARLRGPLVPLMSEIPSLGGIQEDKAIPTYKVASSS